MNFYLFISAIVVLIIVIIIQCIKLFKIKKKYKKIDDVNVECEKIKTNISKMLEEAEDKKADIINTAKNEKNVILDKLSLEQKNIENEIIKNKEKVNQLVIDYKSKKITYDTLVKELSLYENNLNYVDIGFYTPEFNFDTSEEYKENIMSCREEQKEMVKSQNAVFCHTNWTLSNSQSKGESLIKKYKKLVLRTFNNECNDLISKVKWNNIDNFKDRIIRSKKAIERLSTNMDIFISEEYLDLKIKELHLSYEYVEKKHEEKEEQKRIQEQIKEEKKVQEEIDKALKESKDEEERYNKALERVRQEMERDGYANKEKYEEQITELEQQLQEALAKKERAKSMAEQTKAGFVYIISNIGSFGENVFKIGLTRRLDPTERVRELSVASVPFKFDIHALIHCDNAPALETELHKEFRKHQVNRVNNRKEFFNIDLDSIKEFVEKKGFSATFIETPEAKEYRETLALIDSENESDDSYIESKIAAFPSEL